MGLFDDLLGQVGGAGQIGELASKLGLSQEQVQSAVAALGQAHEKSGDTVSEAASSTGLSADTLQNLLGQLGGEDALGKISGLLDRDGDGNPLNDLAGFASKLFGK